MDQWSINKVKCNELPVMRQYVRHNVLYIYLIIIDGHKVFITWQYDMLIPCVNLGQYLSSVHIPT